jgi:hypothetical protein
VRPGGCREASKAAHGYFEAHDVEIRALSLRYFNSEIPKGNKEMVVNAFAVLMAKSPGMVTVISAARIAPPAVTKADSDEDAEDDNNTSQVVV